MRDLGRAQRAVQDRLIRHPLYRWGGTWPALVGFLLGALLGFRQSPADGWPAVAGLFAGLVVSFGILPFWGRRLYRAASDVRGWPREPLTEISLDAEGVAVAGPGVRRTATWAVVSEITPCAGGWTLATRGGAVVAPARFFPDRAAQKAFVALVLEQIGPEARERSAEARAFLADGRSARI